MIYDGVLAPSQRWFFSPDFWTIKHLSRSSSHWTLKPSLGSFLSRFLNEICVILHLDLLVRHDANGKKWKKTYSPKWWWKMKIYHGTIRKKSHKKQLQVIGTISVTKVCLLRSFFFVDGLGGLTLPMSHSWELIIVTDIRTPIWYTRFFKNSVNTQITKQNKKIEIFLFLKVPSCSIHPRIKKPQKTNSKTDLAASIFREGTVDGSEILQENQLRLLGYIPWFTTGL